MYLTRWQLSSSLAYRPTAVWNLALYYCPISRSCPFSAKRAAFCSSSRRSSASRSRSRASSCFRSPTALPCWRKTDSRRSCYETRRAVREESCSARSQLRICSAEGRGGGGWMEGSESIRVTLLDNSKRRIVTVVIGSEASVEEQRRSEAVAPQTSSPASSLPLERIRVSMQPIIKCALQLAKNCMTRTRPPPPQTLPRPPPRRTPPSQRPPPAQTSPPFFCPLSYFCRWQSSSAHGRRWQSVQDGGGKGSSWGGVGRTAGLPQFQTRFYCWRMRILGCNHFRTDSFRQQKSPAFQGVFGGGRAVVGSPHFAIHFGLAIMASNAHRPAQALSSKLIFHDSDSEEEAAQTLHSKTAHQLRPRTWKTNEPARLKPSLMRQQTEEADYENAGRCESVRKSIRRMDGARRGWVGEPLQSKTTQKLKQKPQKKTLWESFDWKEEQPAKEEVVIPERKRVTTISFEEESDEEDQRQRQAKEQKPQAKAKLEIKERKEETPAKRANSERQVLRRSLVKESRTLNKKNQTPLKKKESNFPVEDNEIQPQNTIETNQPPPPPPQQIQPFSLLQKGHCPIATPYWQSLPNLPCADDFISACLSPTPPSARSVYQLRVLGTLLQREYHLWVQAGEIWHLVMKADKLARPTRTEFPFCTYVPTINQFATCCTLSSNLDRSQFELWREEGAKGRNRTRLLCSVSRLESLSGHKCLLVYLVRSGKLYRQGGKTLPQLYREGAVSTLTYLMTTRLPHSLQAQILSDHNLRVSQKSMEFKDPQESVQLLIGKSASKRYKILASGGRSPAEVLAVAIAQVET